MISTIYAALLGLMLVGLSINVIRARTAGRALLGQGDVELTRHIRAQGNFTEYTPLFLILLGGAEFNSLVPWAVHLFGIVFIIARLLHAYSLLKVEEYGNAARPNITWRVAGMMLTFSTIILLAIVILVQNVMLSSGL